MKLQRSTDAAFLESVWTDPDVRDKVPFGQEMPSAAEVLADEGTVFLANEHGGFLYCPKADGIYEVHTQFKRSGWGNHLLDLAKESVRWMFAMTPCIAIVTFVEQSNVHARNLALRVGMKEMAEASLCGREGMTYSLNIKEWVMQTCQPSP